MTDLMFSQYYTAVETRETFRSASGVLEMAGQNLLLPKTAMTAITPPPIAAI